MTNFLTRILADAGQSESAGEMKFKCPSCDDWVENQDCCPKCDEPPEPGIEMKFKCPFCQKWVEWDGGCLHFVFSFEKVNFEYLTCVEDFEERIISLLRAKGYDLDQLPLPLAEWVDNDDDGNPMPSLDKIAPELKFVEYDYDAPRLGGWGILLGFEPKERRSKASSGPRDPRR